MTPAEGVLREGIGFLTSFCAPQTNSARRRLLDRYIMVMLGAAAGGLARYVLSSAIAGRFGGNFPLGTFIVNVSGSFLIGLIMTLITERWVVHPNWRLVLVVGVLGGYTTFSSLEYETLQAMRRGLPAIGLLYAFGSLIVGYLAAWFGMLVAARA
jgi:fluoride exporter